ncbi:hypothetical protein, partial [Aeromonas caviae]|uniref:hypothetical protein n=1 Tax=Aeromonas caviae TaxID=648 RepID=UPI0029DE7F2B
DPGCRQACSTRCAHGTRPLLGGGYQPGVLQYLVHHRDQPLQGLARLALDSAGHPRPSRRCPWPCLSLVPDPGCRQACSTR